MAASIDDLIGVAGKELHSQEDIEEWFRDISSRIGEDLETEAFAAYLGNVPVNVLRNGKKSTAPAYPCPTGMPAFSDWQNRQLYPVYQTLVCALVIDLVIAEEAAASGINSLCQILYYAKFFGIDARASGSHSLIATIGMGVYF